MQRLESSREGLSGPEVNRRLEKHGPNRLPRRGAPSVITVFLRQFVSPLIYVLLAAGVVSLAIGELYDSIFIFAVVLINAIIGTIQEYKSEQSAAALQEYMKAQARVRREGQERIVDAENVVPGDIVLLESGARVPADMRLVRARNLTVDESLLTGESTAQDKSVDALEDEYLEAGDQINMAFAGSSVTSGRGEGLVVATGVQSMLGSISQGVVEVEQTKPPLVVRMEQFSRYLSYAVLGAVVVLAIVSLLRGTAWTEVFFMSVALAVSAIPEGLPVGMTVVLAIGVRRMARRHVIVRKLPAVEGLGSCTYIASDKTGTLTVNRQTVRRISLPGKKTFTTLSVTGETYAGEGEITTEDEKSPSPGDTERAVNLARAGVICNEATLAREDGGWRAEGDAVDLALLSLGYKANNPPGRVGAQVEETAEIPFESQRKYSAKFYVEDGAAKVAVKGAAETLLRMCKKMATSHGETALDRKAVDREAQRLAGEGYRVLAVAEGRPSHPVRGEELGEERLPPLTLLGLVGLIDPLRPGVEEAVAQCRTAGVTVGMVTGDHPKTALAIARQLGIAEKADEVITGEELARVGRPGQSRFREAISRARVFARVSPDRKVEIVRALTDQGHFVAVTGDGVNDAPALRRANIGVAMGSGTDVTKDTGSIIVTDDNFASIVAGIREGRQAYQNLRKVIYLLVSTGAAEVLLFTLALLSGLPLPLVAVQLLWLNLVTNGIQHVALAFEGREKGLMQQVPRDPEEGIFNRLMLGETLTTAGTMALVGFGTWLWLLNTGWAEIEARNILLLLMVLFENYHTFNCRSERTSAFRVPLRNNIFLVFSVAAALGIHLAALHLPFLQVVLETEPVTIRQFFIALALASSVLIASEIHKLLVRRRSSDKVKS